MKKFLLSFFSLLICTLFASAQEEQFKVTADDGRLSGGTYSKFSYTHPTTKITIEGWANKSGGIGLAKAGGYLAVTNNPNNIKIASIEVKAKTASGKTTTLTCKFSDTSYSYTGSTSTSWAGTESGSNNMTQNVENTYKYTINNDYFVIYNSTSTGQVVISEITVNYIGEGGGNTGEDVTEVNSLADFLALADKTNAVKVNTPLTVVYKNGNNIYVTDGEDFVLVYNSKGVEIPELTNGQVLSYITGKFDSYNNLPELIPTEIGTVSQGTEVYPEPLDIEEIGTDALNKYVELNNVTIAAGSKTNNYTANDGTKEIILYNKFYSSVTVPEGDNFKVVGFVAVYGTDLQVIPVSITGGEAKEHVATPTFNPASGTALNIGDVIEVTSETEGATFHYTTDGTTPTIASEILENGEYLYTGGNLTLKVLAVKNGMINSEVATATYTEFIDGEYYATFNFNDVNIASLANSTIKQGSGQVTDDHLCNITGVEFISGPVKLVMSKAEGSTSPRWWGAGSGDELRLYANNTVEFSIVQDGFGFSSIEATLGTSKEANFKKLNFTTIATDTEDNGTWNNTSKVWTAPESNDCVSVKFAGVSENAQLGGFKVAYVEAQGNVAGIDSVNADNSNAPVEYYNLQGVRVNANNIVPGIYVRRQGSQTVKVLVK